MAQPTVPRYRKTLIAMKAEATYATDVFAGTYLAADIVPAFGILPAITREEIENLSTAGDLGRMASIIGPEYVGVQFSMWVRGAGAAYSAGVKPEVDMPFRACGLSSTLDATGGAEKYTYVPTSTFESFTIYVMHQNGASYKMVGCFGTVELGARAGGVMEARFTMMGKLAGVADITYVDGSIASTPQFPPFKSAAFQIGSENFAARINELGFRLNNAMQRIPSINDAAGIAGFYIADRNPRLTIDPELDTVANYDWWTKWATLPATAIDCTFQIGATQYNRLLFTFAKMQIVGQGEQPRDGLVSLPTQLLAMLTSGNDDFSLVFS